MNKGPIILVEDDDDDYELFKSVLQDLEVTNPLIWFSNPPKAMEYLLTTKEQPFFILCDLNLPVQSGMEFKRAIDRDKMLREKSIPFIFYSTAINPDAIKTAYSEMSIQGFFKKPVSYSEIKTTVKTLVDYWKLCKHPNSE